MWVYNKLNPRLQHLHSGFPLRDMNQALVLRKTPAANFFKSLDGSSCSFLRSLDLHFETCMGLCPKWELARPMLRWQSGWQVMKWHKFKLLLFLKTFLPSTQSSSDWSVGNRNFNSSCSISFCKPWSPFCYLLTHYVPNFWTALLNFAD